jgi:prepilin-type N-terminal cleavage/methylation domain-containing protein
MKRGNIFSRARSESGMSLVEVLSSVTIFGLVASGAAVGTISSIKGNTTSRSTMAASSLIHDQVEMFRSLDPDSDPAEFTEGFHWDSSAPVTARGESNGIYYRYWTVTRDSPEVGLAEIAVTVTWRDTELHTLSSTTYVCLSGDCA